MKRAFIILTAAALLPNATLASTGECAPMSGVLDVIQPEGSGANINQARLVQEVGIASDSTIETKLLAGELRDSLPGNPETIIADLMITAYCEYLMTSQSDVALDESVENYQKALYNDVLVDPGDTVSYSDSRPEGWLWGN
ncbi:hypothetical protein [Roseovarius albus]|nr:hypothetical protein [Roseovarius albus]